MKFHPRWTATAFFVVALNASPVSNAALVDSSGGLIYDTELGISWLADANLAVTNAFGVTGINANGSMDWSTAQSWIAAMNTANYLGYSDWRLPITMQPDTTCADQAAGASGGYNCTGSELGHLFYNELGGTAGFPIGTTYNASMALFQNIQIDVYWSGTEYAPTNGAWNFYFSDGNQFVTGKESYLYGWAVHPGDVAAVPLPTAVWLFGSGLLGLIGVARRKARTL
ncbi:MAG: hypothetical protein Tsb0026_13710 [Sulfuricaulis sp.]